MTGRPGEPYCAGVLTLSDKGSRGEREDTSGPLLQEMLQGAGFTVAAYEVIPDQEELIVTTLEQWSDALHLDLIGELTFTEMMLLHYTGRLPDKGQTRVLDAVLVV